MRAFVELTKSHAAAIVAFLRTLPAVKHKVDGPFAPAQESTIYLMKLLPPARPCGTRWPTRFTTRSCGASPIPMVDSFRRVPWRSDRLHRQGEHVTDAAQGADDPRAACVDLELPTQPQHLDVNASIEYVLTGSGCVQ